LYLSLHSISGTSSACIARQRHFQIFSGDATGLWLTIRLVKRRYSMDGMAPQDAVEVLDIVRARELTLGNDLDTLFVIWATSLVLFMQVLISPLHFVVMTACDDFQGWKLGTRFDMLVLQSCLHGPTQSALCVSVMT
jgi:hypothetical protein